MYDSGHMLSMLWYPRYEGLRYMIQMRYNGFMSRDVNPLDFLNPMSPRSPEELATHRLEICKTCDWFRPKTQTCKKCGCFMKLKTTLEKAKCPIGKW